MRIDNYLKELICEGNDLCFDNQGEILNKILKENSIKKLSKKLKVSERLIYYWSKNERPISLINLIKLGIIDDSFRYAEYISINGVKQKTRLCKKLTPELSYLVGYIYGDGHIGLKYSFSISDFSKENIILAQKLLEEIFNLKLKYRFRSDRNYYELNSSWKAGCLILNKVFEMPFGIKNKRLFMPKIIKNSNLKNKLMFSLGFAAADFGGNSLTQTSLSVLEDVKITLKEVGISCKIYGPYGPYKGNEDTKWVMSFNKKSSERLKKLIDNFKKRNVTQLINAPVV